MNPAKARQGLELLPADNATGFKGVTRNSKSPTFSAKMRLGNKIHNLGCSFRSAAEAASPDAADQAADKKAPYKNTIQVGQIQIKTKDGKDQTEKVRTKNIVFKVKSLKALQSNIGVFNV